MSAFDLPGGRLDVVIDTDVMNEVDDQFAIVWAMLRPDRLHLVGLLACPFGLSAELLAPGRGLLTELDRRHLTREIEALGMTAQDVPVRLPAEGAQQAYDELRTLAGLAGLDIPIAHGSSDYLPDAATPVDSEAARLLIELAHQPREGRLYVVGIGCATNLASALLLDPTIAEKIVVLWTSAYPSFWPYENASYNLAQDVPAAQVLLDSGVPLVYVPGYYVGEELRITLPDLEQHVRGHGRLGAYLYDTVRAHPLFKLDRLGSSKVIWDLAPFAWLLDAQWCTMREVATPRMTDDLRWQAEPGRPPMLEMHDLDRDAVYGDLFRLLREHAAGQP